jgi:Protein of unknown function (DUF3616)
MAVGRAVSVATEVVQHQQYRAEVFMSNPIEPLKTIRLQGLSIAGHSLSAIGVVGRWLLVAGDEGNQLQVLELVKNHYVARPELAVTANATGDEVDFEGIATDGELVYAIGSHSAKRKKLKPEKSHSDNRTRLDTIEAASASRDVLVRFRLLASGRVHQFELATLRPLLDAQSVLKPFLGIPCKENGVDIEGLAVRNGELFMGFRGPVLNGGYVPVLRTRFAAPAPTEGELVFANFGGRGIRDLETVSDGFLVLTGPVNDVGSYRVWWWDGVDMLPGTDSPNGMAVELGKIRPPQGAKAEGLTLEAESAKWYQVLVVFDGLSLDGDNGPDGIAMRFRIRKPE